MLFGLFSVKGEVQIILSGFLMLIVGAESLNLFTKILPESKGLQPKTQEYLLRIVKAYQKEV